MDDTATTPAPAELDRWVSFDDAYDAFVKAHPMLGLGSGQWVALHVRRNYGEQLMLAGATMQLVNRRWLAHRDKFGPALFALLQRGPDQIIERAQKRRAAAGQSA